MLGLYFVILKVLNATTEVDCDQPNSIEYYRKRTPYMMISHKPEESPIKVRFDLFFDDAPKTTLNFANILDGKLKKNGIHLTYKNSIFHRIIPGFMMQGGDFTNRNGSGGVSIYGSSFDDEKFLRSHEKGVLSMANRGKNTNGSQFFITFASTKYLDGKHLVFGKIKNEDLHLIDGFEKVATDAFDKPKSDVTIVDCGFEEKVIDAL